MKDSFEKSNKTEDTQFDYAYFVFRPDGCNCDKQGSCSSCDNLDPEETIFFRELQNENPDGGVRIKATEIYDFENGGWQIDNTFPARMTSVSVDPEEFNGVGENRTKKDFFNLLEAAAEIYENKRTQNKSNTVEEAAP